VEYLFEPRLKNDKRGLGKKIVWNKKPSKIAKGYYNKNLTDDLLERKNKNSNKTLKNKYLLSIRIGFKIAKVIISSGKNSKSFCLT
jgi:hypothetical protein